MKRSIAALAVAAAACAPLTPHTRNEARAYAEPERSTPCPGQQSQCLMLTGLQQVVVNAGVNRENRFTLLDVLTPALTDPDFVEYGRALEGCLWKPAVDADGRRVESSFTLAIQR